MLLTSQSILFSMNWFTISILMTFWICWKFYLLKIISNLNRSNANLRKKSWFLLMLYTNVVTIKFTLIYNSKLKITFFFELYSDYIIFDLSNYKFNQQRVDSFKIIEKIDTLTYRFELSFVMQIHFVIFITQMKFVSLSNSDSYQRSKSNNSSSIITKNDDFSDFTQTFNYEIKRLLNRRIISTNKINYLMKRKNYDSKHNVWYFLHVFDLFKNFVDNYDRHHFRSTRISIRISIRIIDVTTIQFITIIQSITVFAFIEQLLLKISSNTKLIRQSTRKKREKRDERDKNRSKNKFD